MAWESRRNGKRYYYRRRKVGGRVLAEYIGTGDLAERIATRDTIDRHAEAAAREAWRKQLSAEKAVDRVLGDFHREAHIAVRSMLADHGYHQHHRGEWRKMRVAESIQPIQQPPTEIGVLSASVQRLVLSSMGVYEVTGQSILAEVEGVRVRLGWHHASAHERLLIECIALAWLRLQLMEQTYSQNTGHPYKIEIAEHMERRLSMCQRRYTEAVTALARVRRLAVGIQINIGQNQVIAHRP